jgi:citrate lyase beta subunit
VADNDALRTSLTGADLQPILADLREAHARFERDFAGDSSGRQPVHTIYGGAHLFRAGSALRIGEVALKSLDEYAPDASTFASVLGLSIGEHAAARLRARVVDKLTREPVEDYRIDFEDGYGHRPDAEEDDHCDRVAAAVAEGFRQRTLPPFIGIRIKPLSAELHRRSLRTLDLFTTALAGHLNGELMAGLRITIPKVVDPAQVAAAASACRLLEERLKLPGRWLLLELMVETPQAILDASGRSPLRAFVAAGSGRVVGAHFGAFDYTALCGITASWQHLGHPACDFARHMMQVALAQSGVHLSDSVTTTLPVPVHRTGATPLSEAQRRDNVATAHRAWKLHFDNVRHSLANGFYQSWDLHPAQLPPRYAAVYEFFDAARADATARLRRFVDEATRATLAGDVFDDAATAQGLLNFFVRGVNCGALTLDEAQETGLTLEELQGRSFARVVSARRVRRVAPGSSDPGD